MAACSDDGADAENTAAASDGGGDPALSAVTVSDDLEAEPTIEFTPPVQITAPDSALITSGDGETIAEGDTIIWRSVYSDASTGDVLESWWQGAPANGVQVTAETLGDEAFAFLTTVPIGSRVAMAGWQTTTSGQSYALIQASDIDRVVSPLRADGEAQEPSGTFPAVSLDENGAPSLESAPEGEAPTETVRETLIQGAGDATREGDYLTMHYTGWNWDSGEQFDSSWERGAPFGFPQGMQKVIPGWDENLLDLPVGSQVMLVVPPAEAYGEEGESEHELAGQTLLFVIDVLDAAHKAD
ncbi:FKBP-type peptidyl-prolyl cis-trans isomerase [Brachybacterium sp. GCM10030267]